MSRWALLEKEATKGSTGNSFCHTIFAANPGMGKTLAARCVAGNNNSI